jgi:hypothetical protein
MQTEDFLTYSVPRLIGQVADTSLTQIDSYVAESTIEFGNAVMKDTSPIPNAVRNYTFNNTFLGVAIRNERQTTGNYPAKSMVSVLTFGRVVIKTPSAVFINYAAYAHNNGVIDGIATSGRVIGYFLTAGGIDDLVVLQIGDYGNK